MKTYNSTLCYIERNHQYLMLHRIKKEQDINAGKWIGVGGKFEKGESPEECLIREVREETGLLLTRYRLRGVVTFVTPTESEYMFLYTADGFVQDNSKREGHCAGKSADKTVFPAKENVNGLVNTGIDAENKMNDEQGISFDCDEGYLEWVDIDKIENLSLWEGDRIFLRLLREEAPFFSLKLRYDAEGGLQEAVLDGTVLES